MRSSMRAVTSSSTFLTLGGVMVLGVCAGAVYVLGFTILHENVDDELRGRVFSALYTLVRFCLLIAIAVGGFLSDGFDWLFDELFDGEVGVGRFVLELPGVRGALWLASLLILGAGGLAAVALRHRSETPVGAGDCFAAIRAKSIRTSFSSSLMRIDRSIRYREK